jgi:polyhydroxybutyrate depolymerase
MTLALIAVLLAQGATEERTLGERTYRFHLGKEAKKPAPLVIVLHGMGSNGQQTEVLSGMSEIADRKGFAVAYPDGQRRMWRYFDNSPDVTFIRDLIDALVKSGDVDARRVYATGISNGAYLTNRLALDIGEKLAAIAPVAGTLPKLMAERAKPPRAMPTMYFHGTADTAIGYDGTDFISKRAMSLGAEDFAAWWAKKNGCAEKPEVAKLEDKEDDGTTVERWTYAGDAPVVFLRIEGGGHTWPGSKVGVEKLLGKTTKDVHASELMWDFFEKHRLAEK